MNGTDKPCNYLIQKIYSQKDHFPVISWDRSTGHRFLCICFLPVRDLQIMPRVVNTIGDRGGTVVKCCATNRKVAGLIPDGVIGIFH